MTWHAPDRLEYATQAIQPSLLLGLMNQVSLLFPIPPEVVKLRRFVIGFDEDAVPSDHGADPDHTIGRKVCTRESRLLELGDDPIVQTRSLLAPVAGQALTWEGVVRTAREEISQRPWKISQRDGSSDSPATQRRRGIARAALGP
jgi:hypothetical protein